MAHSLPTDGLAGLRDKPRPGVKRTHHGRAGRRGRPRETGGEAPARHAPEPALDGRGRDISRSSVNTIWRAFNLQPQRTETFKLSRDSNFVEKVRDIVGLT